MQMHTAVYMDWRDAYRDTGINMTHTYILLSSQVSLGPGERKDRLQAVAFSSVCRSSKGRRGVVFCTKLLYGGICEPIWEEAAIAALCRPSFLFYLFCQGRVACQIMSGDELTLTELLFQNVLNVSLFFLSVFKCFRLLSPPSR